MAAHVSNPPFGTRRKGADTEFLQAACEIASGAVYSLHKARRGLCTLRHAVTEAALLPDIHA